MTLNKHDDIFQERLLKKFPYLSYSSNLIEYFVILGFEDLMILQKILPEMIDVIKTMPLDNDDEPVDIYNEQVSIFKPYTMNRLPTILSSVSSNYKKSMLDDELLINLTFPSCPKAYYSLELSALQYEPNPENITFFINGDSLEEQTKIPFHGYSFIFYEHFKQEFGELIYIPKAITIVSQFPLFNLFNTLCRELLKLFKDDSIEIPLEILVYNLVNFTPSPINISFNLNAFPSLDLSSYTKANEFQLSSQQKQQMLQQNIKTNQIQYNTIQKSIVNSLSGYPLLDFNVSEIFNLLPISMIIEVFIYNLLECEMVFFSSNLEVLNITMYLFSILSYPCIDSMYLWHIVSVNVKEITDVSTTNKFIGKPFSSMIGVNTTYNESIETCDMYHTHFIVDLDKKDVCLRYDTSEYREGGQKHEIDQFIQLISFMEKVLEKKSKTKTSFLKSNLITLMTNLEELSKKAPNVNTTSLKDSSNASFFGNERTEEYNSINKQFQEIFYNFILNLLREYYSFITLETNVNQSNNNTLAHSKSHLCDESCACDNHTEECDKCVEQSMINKNKSNNNLYFLSYKDNDDKDEQNESEKIFNQLFFMSQKYVHFMREFALTFDCFDIYKVGFLLSEEFVSFKKGMKVEDNANENNININFLDIIDLFYKKYPLKINEKESSNILLTNNINFSDFYAYYDKNLKLHFYNGLKKHFNITPSVISVFNKYKITYKYKSFIFDKNLLMQYAYYLSNIPQDKLEQIFPSITTKTKNQIITVPSNAISLSLEEKLIQLKYVSHNELILYIALYIISYFIHCIHNESELQLIINLLGKHKYCYRMYITIIIKSLYKLCVHKLKQKQTINQEFLYYVMLMDSLQEKGFLPNEELLLLIEYFSILKSHYKIEDNEDKICEQQQQQPSQDQTNQYEIKLSENICYDCNYEFDKSSLINIINETDYNGVLEVVCYLCHKSMKPLIHYRNASSKRKNINFYSPKTIHKNISQLSSKHCTNSLTKDDYDLIETAIINIIIYLDDNDNEQKCLKQMMFNCLNEVNHIINST